AVEESARIHKAVQQNSKWTGALIRSLGDHAKVQQNLAGETKGLKEKLKGAPGFELVLDRTARAMEAAVKVMEERKARAIEQRGALEPFEKEEVAAENKADADTQKRQREASRRLEHLLDALKSDDGLAQRPKKKADNKPPDGPKKDGDKEGAARPPGDGIPEIAQLNVLRAEQQEVNDRTKEFAEQ